MFSLPVWTGERAREKAGQTPNSLPRFLPSPNPRHPPSLGLTPFGRTTTKPRPRHRPEAQVSGDPSHRGQHADPAVLELRLAHPVDGQGIGDAQRVEALLLAHPAF